MNKINDLDVNQLESLNNHLLKVGMAPEMVDNGMEEHIPEPQESKKSLKDKIRELENERSSSLGNLSNETISDSSFKDENGDETFYVKNVSGTHIVISDLDIPKIPKGEICDLLTLASLEDIKKSRDVRRAMSGSERMLKRLTERQYFEELQRVKDSKRKIEIMRKQHDETKSNSNQKTADRNMPHFKNTTLIEGETSFIRPMIDGWIEKLNLTLNHDPEVSKFGINDEEFISWVQNEKLSDEEIDYILTHPIVVKRHNIKAALFQKKTSEY